MGRTARLKYITVHRAIRIQEGTFELAQAFVRCLVTLADFDVISDHHERGPVGLEAPDAGCVVKSPLRIARISRQGVCISPRAIRHRDTNSVDVHAHV
ncbi:hypothetical protein WL95_00265 [Burkholderia cepacia]|nr:hypothetical protein WL95_00265 [Burkholderia cepacia]